MSAVTRRRGRSPYGAPEPRIAADADPLLAEMCRAVCSAAARCWATYDRDELLESVGQGADGTPSFLIDTVLEKPVIDLAIAHGVNLLSEEVGFLDRGSPRTVVVDPLDGSANAAAGVPLSCFSAALVEDGRALSALTCWIETGTTISATRGRRTSYATTGRCALDGAAVSLLRPKWGERGASDRAWWAIARRAARVRILSSSALESMLVAQGSIDAFADPGSDTHRIVDLAAAMLIVEEAGGAVLDAYGRELTFDPDLTRRWSGVVAASAGLAEEIAAAITAALPVGLGTVTAAGITYDLRRAREDDLSDVCALLDDMALSDGTGGADEARRRALFRRIDADPRDLLVVVIAPGGEAVATLQYSLLTGLAYRGLVRAQLEAFAVRADHRGRGLGGALLSWLVERAQADGAGVVQLSSNLQRERALAFYRRHGFEASHAGLKRVIARPACEDSSG